MAIDMGLDDPVALEALNGAIGIVDRFVDGVHMPYSEDCEVYRLVRALPPGQMSFDRTMFAGAEAARGALGQISYILRHKVPTNMSELGPVVRTPLMLPRLMSPWFHGLAGEEIRLDE